MHTNSPKMNRFPTGHEDLDGWAFQRARTHEVTLSPEEVIDAGLDGIDVRAAEFVGPLNPHNGFVRFNGRWYVPMGRTTVASGLDPATHPGEFIAMDNAGCIALDRVCAHWRSAA